MLLPDGFRKIPVRQRFSKVHISDFGALAGAGSSFAHFFDSLPNILAGQWLKRIVDKVVQERKRKKQVLWMMGAHPVKVGVSPWIIRLMEAGAISHFAGNTSVALHDVEIAFWGKTSEDVSKGICKGNFASAAESAEFLNRSAEEAARSGLGLAEQIGKNLLQANPEFRQFSLFGQAYRLGIPCTLHGALGTDVPHIHPEMKGAAWGETLMRDFYIFCHSVSQLQNGGVVFNVGSAVILPVTFEKALALCRNLQIPVKGFWGVNFDFLQLYRANLNPVQRAKELNGEGFAVTAHHEFLIPLFAQAVLEKFLKEKHSGLRIRKMSGQKTGKRKRGVRR